MDFTLIKYCCIFKDCGKEYLSKPNLKRHIDIIHLKRRTVECPICHKNLMNSVNMKEHNLIHSNIKPYKCQICGVAFRHKSKLGSHKKFHTEGN